MAAARKGSAPGTKAKAGPVVEVRSPAAPRRGPVAPTVPASAPATPDGAPPTPRIHEPVWLVRIVLVLFLLGFAAFLAREVQRFVEALNH